MNELPSTTFRKVYATLRAPVVVTVNGHPIGTYSPIDSRSVEGIRKLPAPAFTAYRPVPKPGAKR